MIAKILEVIMAVLESFKMFDRWFKKSTSKTVNDSIEQSREEMDEAKKTGRPKWN